MKLEITLPIKPLSYNAYYRNNKYGKRIKTGKGLAFDEELGLLLESYADALVRFGRLFEPSTNMIKMYIDVGNPKYLLKDGSRLSKTAGDVDNYLKVTQDKLFNIMGVDDYACRHTTVSDYASNIEEMHISLEIVPQRLSRCPYTISENLLKSLARAKCVII